MGRGRKRSRVGCIACFGVGGRGGKGGLLFGKVDKEIDERMRNKNMAKQAGVGSWEVHEVKEEEMLFPDSPGILPYIHKPFTQRTQPATPHTPRPSLLLLVVNVPCVFCPNKHRVLAGRWWCHNKHSPSSSLPAESPPSSASTLYGPPLTPPTQALTIAPYPRRCTQQLAPGLRGGSAVDRVRLESQGWRFGFSLQGDRSVGA